METDNGDNGRWSVVLFDVICDAASSIKGTAAAAAGLG
jgi:hypothetical protein